MRGRPKGIANPNAGRRAKDPDNPLTERLYTLVSKATRAQFDTIRGSKAEADVLREAIEQWIERNKAN